MTKGNEGEGARARRFPQLLPDSRYFLYTDGATDVEQMGIYWGSSDGGEPKRLLADQSNAVYVSGPGGARAGYLLFVRERTLMAQPFDAGRLEFSGDVFPVAEPVAQAGNATFYGFSASATGALAYSGTDAFPNTQLTWFDRQGKVMEKVGDPGIMSSVSLSPDARRAAVDMASSPDLLDVWLIDLGRNTFSRFTSQPKEESGPVWSPTGDKVAFTWQRPGGRQVYAKDAEALGKRKRLPAFQTCRTNSSPTGPLMDALWLCPRRHLLCQDQRFPRGPDNGCGSARRP